MHGYKQDAAVFHSMSYCMSVCHLCLWVWRTWVGWVWVMHRYSDMIDAI